MPAKTLTPELIKRPSYYFEIPEKARTFPEKDIKNFRMREYTLAQELEAARIAQLNGDTAKALETELVRRSVYEINGVEMDDPSWLDEQSPTVRSFLGLALNRMSQIGKDDIDDFLKSMVVTAG